jgi:uncharacterized protein (DUF1697 family)
VPRYVAFLRAINVGGHTVKMPVLRDLFEGLGFEEVETFIASGNVIFETSSRARAATLEGRIEDHLASGLGYDVETFLRTPAELAKVAKQAPFGAVAARLSGVYVGFLKEASSQAARRLAPLAGGVNHFALRGRELYWGCATGMSKSGLTGNQIEKAVEGAITLRNMNTVERLVAKYGS